MSTVPPSTAQLSAAQPSRPPRGPWHSFFLAVLALFVPLVVPLLFELIIKAFFVSGSSSLLEPTSVMLAAPMLAVGVGIASRFEGVFGFALVVAACLAVMYGAQMALTSKEAPKEPAVELTAPQESAAQPPAGESTAPLANQPPEAHPQAPTFWSRIGLGYPPEEFSWIGISLMTSVFLVERLIRHIWFAEPFEFEWDK